MASTHSYFHIAKNRLRFTRQAAPVLFAGLHHTPQFGGRLPCPSGIEQEGSGKGNEMGITPLQNSLCLLSLRDQAHCDGGQAGFVFDYFGKRYLVFRADCNFLLSRNPA